MVILWFLVLIQYGYCLLQPEEGYDVGKASSKNLPIVFWHGMGDSCCFGIQSIADFVTENYNVFTYSINSGSLDHDDFASDIASGFIGNVNDQVQQACETLASIPELSNGYHAIGISQGSQFLRAVVQRCQHTGPRMHTLVTLGGQHTGIVSLPNCHPHDPNLSICKWVQLAVSYGAYLPYIRDHVVQAQYFRDPYRYEEYLVNNPFLPDINNELEDKSEQYRINLSSLQNLVLVMFTEDSMVVPRESSWFSEYDGLRVRPLRNTTQYKEDWLGLRTLDERGRLHMVSTKCDHLQFEWEWFVKDIMEVYLVDNQKAEQ